MTWERLEVALKRGTLMLGFVIALGGAAGVFVALWRTAGPLASVAVGCCVIGAFVAWSVPKIATSLQVLHDRFENLERGQRETSEFLSRHFEPNGHEDRWPELRDKPLREMLGEVWKRFEDGSRWMRDHEAIHDEQQNRRTR